MGLHSSPSPRRWRVTVEGAGKPGRPVRADGDLLDDANTTTVTHFRDDEILQVYRGEVGWVEFIEPDRTVQGTPAWSSTAVVHSAVMASTVSTALVAITGHPARCGSRPTSSLSFG